jgi:hypothetical protein
VEITSIVHCHRQIVAGQPAAGRGHPDDIRGTAVAAGDQHAAGRRDASSRCCGVGNQASELSHLEAAARGDLTIAHRQTIAGEKDLLPRLVGLDDPTIFVSGDSSRCELVNSVAPECRAITGVNQPDMEASSVAEGWHERL